MSKAVKPVPEGFHTVTAHLTVRDAAKAIAFYQAAFGAQQKNRMTGPDGRVVHAELRFGDSIVFLADEFPGMPGGTVAPETVGGRRTGGINLYVEDADQLFDQAVRAGATPVMPVADSPGFATGFSPCGGAAVSGNWLKYFCMDRSRSRCACSISAQNVTGLLR